MADNGNRQDGVEAFWHSGKVPRRKLIGYGAGALGATMLVPAPWQAAFGQAKPYKIGTLQPLSGAGAAGGKTALVGIQMAVDRINKSGGINGRPIELIVADDESKPDVGRRKVEKLLVEDKVDVHVGGFSPISASPACPCSRNSKSSTSSTSVSTPPLPPPSATTK